MTQSYPLGPAITPAGPQVTNPIHIPIDGTIASPLYPGISPATGFDSLPYAATVNLDLSLLTGQFKTITLTGNLTFTNSNIAAGRAVLLRLLPGASSRNLTFPIGWKFYSDKPTSIAANKGGLLSLTYFGSTDADCVAVYKQQP